MQHALLHVAGAQFWLQAETFRDDFSHGHAGIQRRIRVLKNHLHFWCHGTKVLGLIPLGQLFARKGDAAAGFIVKTQQGFAQSGFARAAFPNQANDFFGVYRKTDIIDRVYALVLPMSKYLRGL